jgi:uncharacterized membrane protein
MEYQSGAVRPADSFGDGWSIIKNDYWIYVLMAVVAGVIIIVASLILNVINGAISGVIAGALGMATSNAGDVARTSAAIVPEVIKQVIGIFVTIIVSTLSGIFLCGIYKSMSRVAAGGRAEFGDLFSGFENMQACLIIAAIMAIIQFVFALVMLFTGVAVGIGALGVGGLGGIVTRDGQINPAVAGGLILVFLAFMGIYLVAALIWGALTAFIYPLIGERNLPGAEAFMTSVKAGVANVGGLILLLLLGGLILVAGAIPCGLGLPFVFPIYLAGIFSAYRSVFGAHGNFRQQNPPPPPTFGQQPGW